MRDRLAFLFLNPGHLCAHMSPAIFALVVVVPVTAFGRPCAALLTLTVGAVAVPLVAWLRGTGGFAGMFAVLAGCAAAE